MSKSNIKTLIFPSTAQAIRDKKKTVTRRPDNKQGIKTGDTVYAYSQSIKKGGEHLATLRITDARKVKLNSITPADMEKEGMPGGSVAQFIGTWILAHEGEPDQKIWRFEFEYVQFYEELREFDAAMKEVGK